MYKCISSKSRGFAHPRLTARILGMLESSMARQEDKLCMYNTYLQIELIVSIIG